MSPKKIDPGPSAGDTGEVMPQLSVPLRAKRALDVSVGQAGQAKPRILLKSLHPISLKVLDDEGIGRRAPADTEMIVS